jgi:hypothetical protein
MMSKNDWQIDGSPESRRKLQEYARHAMIKRLLEDILFDMTVCRLEHWDVMEYPKMICAEMSRLLKRQKVSKNDCEQLNLF